MPTGLARHLRAKRLFERSPDARYDAMTAGNRGCCRWRLSEPQPNDGREQIASLRMGRTAPNEAAPPFHRERFG